jgi:hypothetical protein
MTLTILDLGFGLFGDQSRGKAAQEPTLASCEARRGQRDSASGNCTRVYLCVCDGCAWICMPGCVPSRTNEQGNLPQATYSENPWSAAAGLSRERSDSRKGGVNLTERVERMERDVDSK